MNKMKSKSFNLKRSPTDTSKHNKTFDFISLYKSAAENSSVLGNKEGGDGIDKENSFIKSQNETPRRASSPSNRKKKGKQEPLDISRINIEGPILAANSKNSPLNQSKITSTPRASYKDKNEVKSIMKNSTVNDDTMDGSQSQHSSKPKKRNKSVSFMLDENEEVVPKKTKSEESLVSNKKKTTEKSKPVNKPAKADINKEKKLKKLKKQQIEKTDTVGDTVMDTEPVQSAGKKVAPAVHGDVESSLGNAENTKQEKKRKLKHKKQKKTDASNTESNNNEEAIDNKNKKINKKKRKDKSSQPSDVEVGEPAAKSRKKEVKPEVIAENLENLTIGDNPHTLTSLLDEMTVADKDKRKKNKKKLKKDSAHTKAKVENTEGESEGAKEKVKWTKKWNKGKKAVGSNVAVSVIVENLPLTLICSYKSTLSEHFEKCGAIKKVGVAEVYPNVSDTGFTTTIQFESETGATAALSEDGAVIGGNRIQVKQPLPPTQTTVVVRSYASLSDQSICSTFSEHARIRSIRRLVKAKKAIETVFIEFDGPEAVDKAIELSKGAKVAGKKIHVAKYEERKKKKVKAPSKASAAPADSDGEADSEDSND